MRILRNILGTLMIAGGGAMEWNSGNFHPQNWTLTLCGGVLIILGRLIIG